jgi:phage shock protein PspC (stress-responsive transcriptional regulator)
MKHLRRPRKDARIFGVCAAYGKYFNIDPVFVRIIFLAGIFLTLGSTVLVYIISWLIIPEE